jgi:PTS system cellobiose-specific IIC component
MNIQAIGKKYGNQVNKGVIKFSKNVIIKSIMGGMARLLPITIVGSVTILLASIPFEPYTEFITKIGLFKYLTLGTTLTNDLISIYLTAALAYEMSRHYKKSVINSILIAELCFFIVTPLVEAQVGENTLNVLSLTYLGAKGMFVSIFVSLISVRLYVLFIDKGPKIRLHPSVPGAISSSFESLFPVIGVALVFILVSAILDMTSYGDIHNLIYTILQKPLEGASNSLATLLLIAGLGEIFWWFGINSSVTSAIYESLYRPLAIANASALAAGVAMPNVLNTYFFNTFKGPRHLVLATMLLLLSRSKQLKAIGKVSFVPGIFGISEPMKFGIPMVFNPITLIPMVFSPIICLTEAYFATIIGFLPKVGVDIPWSMPGILSGFLAAGWQGAVVQIIQMITIFFIYLPFFKLLDKTKVIQESELVIEEEE